MSYFTELARLLAHQLTKFATMRRHQLIGQVATIDFWLNEARLCLGLLDGYSARYKRLHDAQMKYVMEHKVVDFDPRNPKVNVALTPPKRASDDELDNARSALREAVYRFLVRCYNKGFIEEDVVRRESAPFGIVVMPTDLKPRR
ncbi:MAG: hypothetical protein EXR98_23465 [Gemmataceae bacterium]|nr:hypothetical protein [Gemmataceae bacterium]